MNTVKWIWNTTGKRKWMVVILTLLQCTLALSGIVFALLMRRTIDSAVAGGGREFWGSGLALAGLILFQILLRAANRFCEEETKAAMENRFRQVSFAGILRRDYRTVSSYHTGELMNRMTSDTAVVTEGVITLIPNLLSMVIRILGVLVVMYTIEPLFSVVFLVGGCLIAGLSLLPRKWLKWLHKRVQEADGYVRCFLQECLESLLIIHTFGCDEKMEKAGADRMKEHKRVRMRKSNVSNLFSTGLNLAMQCGYLFGFIWCGYGILEGRISYGTLTAVIQLIGQIQTPFAGLGNAFPRFAVMLASAERLMELTGEVPARERQMGQAENVPDRDSVYAHMQAIEFDHVTFRYDDDRQVLTDDTFAVRKGEFVALTGSSGIGKSTIMKLMLSVYEPDSGEIRLKMDEGELMLSELPEGLFAYVPQGNHLMSGTIREVVGFAEQSENIDEERMIAACKAACAEEFIRELPGKYDTLLGEKGAGLSEGQMQRLAVARAVYSGCPVLLLDESTSALDADTERRLIASLKELSGRTALLVTHRKEVWEVCDRVMRMEGR